MRHILIYSHHILSSLHIRDGFFFGFLSNFPLVNIPLGLFNVAFNHYALLTDRTTEKEQPCGDIHNEEAMCMHINKPTFTMHAHKRLAHQVRSVFPHCNSSSYQPLTSDFCPAGMCTSSVSGCTPICLNKAVHHLVVESKRGEGMVQLGVSGILLSMKYLWNNKV